MDDLGIELAAPSLPQLFRRAAAGMMGLVPDPPGRLGGLERRSGAIAAYGPGESAQLSTGSIEHEVRCGRIIT